MVRNFLSDFSNYLGSVCSELVMLQPARKDAETFFRNVNQEFLTSLRGRAQFPCVIREGVGWSETPVQYSDNDGELMKVRNISFIVADSYMERNSVKDVDVAVDMCEMIGEEILKRMKRDVCKVECLGDVDLSAVDTAMEVNEAGKYVMMQFRLKVASRVDECVEDGVWIVK